MKQQSRSITSLVVWVAVLALVLTGVTTVQAAGFTDKIVVKNQDLNTGIAMLDSVTAANDGWVVLYKNPNLNPDEIVGHAWVHQGVNPDVKVIVNMSKIGNPPMLWAALLADPAAPSVRHNWGPNGLPGTAAGSKPAAVTAFATTANPGPSTMPATGTTSANPVTSTKPVTATTSANPVMNTKPGTGTTSAKPGAERIVVKNQDLNTGIAMLDSVTAAQDGWVVLYKNPSLNSNDIVGHAWVHQGVNPDVKVVVNMNAIGNPPTLWAALLADGAPPNLRHNWPDGLPGSAAGSTPAAVTAFATHG